MRASSSRRWTDPTATFPPTSHGLATLKRRSDWGQVNIQTSGLPAGAYTVWWVVFNTPAGSTGGCGEDDLFNPDANVSVFWATGGIRCTIVEAAPSSSEALCNRTLR